MKNKFNIIGIALLGILMLQSCKKDEGSFKENLTVREAVLSGGNMQIPVKIGTPLQLNLAVNPGNKSVTEATYNNKQPEIASFSNSGIVTGLKVGTDTVTITSGNLQVWYLVVVSE